MSDNLAKGERGKGSGRGKGKRAKGEREAGRTGRKGIHGPLGNEKPRRPKPTGRDGERER